VQNREENEEKDGGFSCYSALGKLLPCSSLSPTATASSCRFQAWAHSCMHGKAKQELSCLDVSSLLF